MERYQSLKNHIIARLEKELRPELYYHGTHHILDVLNAAENIAQSENVDEVSLELLKVAVLFHDSGFIFDSADHEKISCRIAQETLPTYGYDSSEIEKICGMIMATKWPHHPNNFLEMIICDADLDYLGRNDFNQIADTLFAELNHFGVIHTKREWNLMQERFFGVHHYFTNTSKNNRAVKKQQHLEEIQRSLLTLEE
jgi:predicted metal-dependent HD superfamily phosphohydrolase